MLQTETASAPQPVARPRNHPVPARRKIPPSHRPEPLQTSPPLRGKLAQEFELPPLPPKSPPLPPKSNVRPPPHYGLTERGPPRSPPIPRRHGGVSTLCLYMQLIFLPACVPSHVTLGVSQML